MNTPTIHSLPMSAELTEMVIALCAREHEADNDMPVRVTEIQIGNGRHTHDATCKRNCLYACDDSDFIVTMQYAQCGWLAVYGVVISDDGEDIACWMD